MAGQTVELPVIHHAKTLTWCHSNVIRRFYCIFNSLTPGRFQFNSRSIIFKLALVNGGWGISYEIALRWMPLDLTDDKSTLVQVMAWCGQATSHYLSQCWPRSLSPYGVTRPQWVKYSTSKEIYTWLVVGCVLLHYCAGQFYPRIPFRVTSTALGQS